MKDYLEQKDNSSSFYVHNGPINGEDHLLMALAYFTGGSYFDIVISRGKQTFIDLFENKPDLLPSSSSLVLT